MKKEKKIQLFVIGIMVVTVVAMGIGFAAFSQSLTISGLTTINTARWEVQITGLGQGTTAEEANYTSTTVTYTVNLSTTGECRKVVYEIENSGTINAELKGINTSGLSEDQKKYLTVTGTYGTSTTDAEGNLDLTYTPIGLDAEESSELELNICYIEPANGEDLPSNNQSITLVTTLNYEQAE